MIANFPAEAFGKAGADHGALAVLDEVSPLVIGHDELGKDLALVFDIDDELRKEVFLILIDATKPVVVGNDLDARDAQNFVAVGKRQRLDDGDAIDDDQTVRAGDV